MFFCADPDNKMRGAGARDAGLGTKEPWVLTGRHQMIHIF